MYSDLTIIVSTVDPEQIRRELFTFHHMTFPNWYSIFTLLSPTFLAFEWNVRILILGSFHCVHRSQKKAK